MYVPCLFPTAILKENAECPAASNLARHVPTTSRCARRRLPGCLAGAAAGRPGEGPLEIWRNPLKRLNSEKEMQELKDVSRFHEHSRKALARPKAVLKITILGVEGGGTW